VRIVEYKSLPEPIRISTEESIRRLRIVLTAAEKVNADKRYMKAFGYRDAGTDAKVGECGTVGCLLGHAAFTPEFQALGVRATWNPSSGAGSREVLNLGVCHQGDYHYWNGGDELSDFLGISSAEMHHIFWARDWDTAIERLRTTIARMEEKA